MTHVQAPFTAAAPFVFTIAAQVSTHLNRVKLQVEPALHPHFVDVARIPVLRGSRVQSRRHSRVVGYQTNPVAQTQVRLSVEAAMLLLLTVAQSREHP